MYTLKICPCKFDTLESTKQRISSTQNIAAIIEIDTKMQKTLHLHDIIDQGGTIIDQIHAHIVHNTDLHIDHPKHAIPLLGIDHFHMQGTNNFNKTLLQIDLLLEKKRWTFYIQTSF